MSSFSLSGSPRSAVRGGKTVVLVPLRGILDGNMTTVVLYLCISSDIYVFRLEWYRTNLREDLGIPSNPSRHASRLIPRCRSHVLAQHFTGRLSSSNAQLLTYRLKRCIFGLGLCSAHKSWSGCTGKRLFDVIFRVRSYNLMATPLP